MPADPTVSPGSHASRPSGLVADHGDHRRTNAMPTWATCMPQNDAGGAPDFKPVRPPSATPLLAAIPDRRGGRSSRSGVQFDRVGWPA